MMRVALLSNVTTDFLAGMIKKNSEVYQPAGFDTWQQEIMMVTSGLYDFKPDVVVVLLYADAFADIWTDPDKGTTLINEWAATINALTSNLPGVPVMVSSLDISCIKCHYGSEHRQELLYEQLFIEEIEKIENAYILPVKDAITNIGRKAFYSPKMWYAGSMPYSMKGLNELNQLINQYTGVIKGARKKCIAVDLDNTLWGGVIGEDGVNGIVLSDNKEGARYKDAQRVLKKMRKQGVMLAILSKNNPEDVEPVFNHSDMVLQHEDFVAEVINWEPKTVNIRQLAENLNIGLDSFVFLDDNPAERERMRAECPEVEVIDFPKDSSLLPEAIEEAYNNYFLALNVTSEDAKKTAMYRAETQRREAMTTAASVEDYLRKLEMKIDIHIMRPEEEKRVTQLINKTNQFNVTTKRYTEEQIHKFAISEDSDVVTVHMSDKYGDQGLVSVLILHYSDDEADIDTFLMSCRVMGRNAENEIMYQLRKLLTSKRINKVKAAYIKTAKNAPVLDLFEKMGFTLMNGTVENIGDRKDYEAYPASIIDSPDVFSEVTVGL